MSNNPYAKRNAAHSISDQMVVRPHENKNRELAFDRTKIELKKNLLQQIRDIENLTYKQYKMILRIK